MSETVRVWVWRRKRVDGEERYSFMETVEVEPETPHVWQNDPHYHSPSIALDIHPYDRPVTLNVYTSESVRSPPGYDNHVEKGYWDGPIERGLAFPDDSDAPPFGCEVWGRVMFFVEKDDA